VGLLSLLIEIPLLFVLVKRDEKTSEREKRKRKRKRSKVIRVIKRRKKRKKKWNEVEESKEKKKLNEYKTTNNRCQSTVTTTTQLINFFFLKEKAYSEDMSGHMQELGYLFEDALADHHSLWASEASESRTGDAVGLAATTGSSQVGDVVSIVHMEHGSV
jgi:hypothetical protein